MASVGDGASNYKVGQIDLKEIGEDYVFDYDFNVWLAFKNHNKVMMLSRNNSWWLEVDGMCHAGSSNLIKYIPNFFNDTR